MVFETLNFRGKQLTGLERFKNRILYLISKLHTTEKLKTQCRQRVNKSWLDVYKWLGKNKDNELNDDTFLKAFWLLYFSNKNMVSKDFKAYQKNIFTEIFHLEETNQNIFLERNELYHWLNEMSKSVKLWFFINNPYFFDDKDEKFEYLYNRRI
ncbi:hypothetical protein [Riemerella anatipestifer]|nr:hypothetical protein [Riemerella anatipestifer]MBT0552409.1 hypothetical protein [Riemerella anatipestifer]MBT0554718.1 hypothetical protein [Riemerella anatipestifer]MCE3025192.1 hypothetical protein [Riemerella anatipestifer]MCU7542095.1 hypothetical protein [Riemerella anatipestifer]MCU7560802.1 hypothetical protein [Riemerella anatipestifer]